MNNLFKGIPPNVLVFIIILQSMICIMGALVAIDARERGLRKDASVFWSVIVMFFPPFILLYLMFRTLRLRQDFMAGKKIENPILQPPPPAPVAGKCPYCNEETEPGAKLCKSCGRLL